MKKRIDGVTVYGIDIGKNTFHVVGLDSLGNPVLHSKFRRDRLLVHFANTPAALIGMENCSGSQWLARKLQASDHTIKIISVQFVKPYVKSNKNDTVDAAAIAEAVTRRTMRFVQVRQPEQSARQALHRVRDRYMSQRTGLINQIRGFLLEFGIPVRQGVGVLRLDVPRGLGDEQNKLPPSMRTLLADLWNDFKLLETRIEELSKLIQRSVQYSDTARRLMTVPGIGPLAATALEASAGNGHQLANGRFFVGVLTVVHDCAKHPMYTRSVHALHRTLYAPTHSARTLTPGARSPPSSAYAAMQSRPRSSSFYFRTLLRQTEECVCPDAYSCLSHLGPQRFKA